MNKIKNHNVAVIMSVYKSDDPEALIESVNSILNQSYKCDLFLYQDGPVPEVTQEVIDRFRVNSSVHYYRGEENSGLAFALNRLIDKVIGNGYHFIARMDSDDIAHVDRIFEQVHYFNNNPSVDVCGTSCREFGASYALDEKHLPTTHEQLLIFSITRCPFIHPTVMFRESVFSDGNRYPTNTLLTEDMALWFELLSKGYRFGNINKVLLDYCLTEDTINRRKGLGKAMSEVRIRTRNMFILKQFSFKNLLLIYSRVVFHLMPSFLVKIAYKKAR